MLKHTLIALLILAAIFGCAKTEKSSGVATVTMWAHEGQPAEKAAVEQIVAAFNQAHKDVQIKLEFKQEQGYTDRVNAAAMASSLPDILDVDGPLTATFAENGILAPVSISEADRKDFLPTVLSQGTYNGKLYTLGAFESTVVVFFNKAVMNECGLKPPVYLKDVWTWQQFVDALRTIKSKKTDILPLETFMVWGGEWLTYAFLPLLWSNDGAALCEDGTKSDGCLNGKASVEAMQAFQAIFKEKLSDANAPEGRFTEGKAAMAWGVFNRFPLYKEAGIDFGMMPLPGLKKSSSPSGSWCWGMTSAVKNKEAAQKALLWIVDATQGIPPIVKANGGVPARESALANVPEYEKSRWLYVNQLRQTARSRPVTPAYATLTKEVSRAMADIANGSDVQKTLDQAAKRIDVVLKK